MYRIFIILSIALVFMITNAHAQSQDAPARSLPLYDADAWAMHFNSEEDLATHRLTGMTCPYSMPQGYGLVKITQSGAFGAPIQCTYRNDETAGFVTMSAIWLYGATTVEEMALTTLAISEGYQEGALEGKEGAPFQADFDSTQIADCYKLRLPFASETINKSEQIAACKFGKWTFQVHQTTANDEGSFETILNWALSVQGDMADNLDQCIAPIIEASTVLPTDPSELDGQLLKDILNSQVIMRGVLGTERAVPTMTPQSCLLAYLSNDTVSHLVLRDKNRPSLPLSIFSTTLDGPIPQRAIWIEQVFTLGNSEDAAQDLPPTYALFSQDKNGSNAIHKLYQNVPPNDEQALQDALAFFNNQLPPMAFLAEGDPGQWTWHIPE